jgi:hypothetical protein
LGRWDDQGGTNYGGPRRRRNWARIFKFVIIGGFVVLATSMAAFMIPRAGLNVEIHQRSEVIGTMQTISVGVTNNSFETMRGVTVQFGDGEVLEIGDLAPFQGRLLSPDADNLDFDRVTATANDGATTTVKHRDFSAIAEGH